MRKEGGSFDFIKFEKDTLSHLIKAGGLDNFTTDYLDDSTTAVKDICMDILSNEDSRIKLFALLEKHGQIYEECMHRFCHDDSRNEVQF